jgi:hypothetical protein
MKCDVVCFGLVQQEPFLDVNLASKMFERL